MRTIIDEKVYEAANAAVKKVGKKGTVAKKLQAVIASYKHGVSKASEVLDVSRGSIHIWAKQLKSGDFEGLINKSKHQEGLKLKDKHKEQIKDWLENNPNMTIKEVRLKLYHFP